MCDNKRFLITESTEKLVKEIITEDLDTLSDQEIIDKLKDCKKFIVRLTESGQIEIKQVLLG